ncbi:nicotinate (nicotinamide) nucleotide adenylyltransferase [Brackiella oedipodis]|uniref:nicotinate (nicotinamide) nucleotide adenylyltransferase n=1 Tax=Brackiella oedipodis TaxID=124225 RepID=UPI00048AEF16|nr:nicotinate (nicotinamide) nucleotide adenylyltransferase [Brackiella oedipodis]
MTKQANKIGLLGGSFNPVHLTHVQLALAAWQQLSLQEVQLLPAAQPWQKDPLEASTTDRVAMLRLAIQDYPQLHINTTEIERGGPTYTIDTVRALPKTHEYVWIMGSDQLQNFCTWNGWQEIVELVYLAVAKRPDYELKLPAPLQQHLQHLKRPVYLIDFAEHEVSSTDIRQTLEQHRFPAHKIHPDVYRYIQEHHLYQN